ncbi:MULTISPECIES: class I SAM-dependent methyltransferase [unclassified Nocardia]|uniref:methyltransferase domain-containing protein n=1 Tax=unclassified Nocardia TaxID=2637762 RepID=UPI001CE47201|nr:MULTISPECIES: class I SAM-dependent methyltransferase [unclassified Nocardia]
MSKNSVGTPAPDSGAAIFTPASLSVYDLIVLRFNNSLVWRCPSGEQLALYNANLSGNHLDIGPGSGWYLSKATFPVDDPTVALFDLNQNSLNMTTRRLRQRGIEPERLVGNVVEPLGLNTRFDSVAANYVMHCVPGNWAEKGIAFRHIADATSDTGRFFGSTILARGVPTGWMARTTLSNYNARHIFHNADDDFDGLSTALNAAFGEVELTVRGLVACWTARSPRRIG